ncbi:transcriptional activator SPT8, partial [Tremellales sp. Uapishka_1]
MRSDDEDDEEDYDEDEEDGQGSHGMSGEDGENGVEYVQTALHKLISREDSGSDESEEDNGEGQGEEDDDEEEDAEGDEDDNSDDEEEDGDEEDDEDDEEEDGEAEDVEMDDQEPDANRLHTVETSLYAEPTASTEPDTTDPLQAVIHDSSAEPVHRGHHGYIRAYDFWASVNGGQVMTAQQRGVVGLGESISKAGVGRGWWSCDVAGTEGVSREPIFSLAVEGDGLWALAGTQVALESEADRQEWDLNTGQVVRNYPTHGAQLSSVELQPLTLPPTPPPSPPSETLDGENISVSMGPTFFEPRSTPTLVDIPPAEVEMAEEKSQDSYDPLFDDDAEGEDVPATIPATPTQPFNLALPKPKATINPNATNAVAPQSATSTGRQAAATIPILSETSFQTFSDNILLTSSMDGQVVLIDRRVPMYDGGGVGRLLPSKSAPPWCMKAVWLGDGTQVLAARRNGTIDIWDVRKTSSTSPNLLRTLKTPAESGPISCLVAFPDGKHIASASQDNVRLWDTSQYFRPEESMKKSKSRPEFKIIAGQSGTVSQMIVDPTCRFLVTASGDRGWGGESTRMVLIHEIKW